MRAPRSTVLPLVAVAVTLVFWSSAFVAIRHLGHTFTPGALSLGRLLVGSLALGVVLATRGWAMPTRREWPGLVAIGLLWFGLYNVALNAGELRVDAGTAAMLIQLSPVLVAVLAAIFLKERATPALGVGLLVAFAGVVLIATSTSDHGDRDPIGVALCLVSAAAYAVSLILQKPLVARLPAIQVTWIACTVGAVACLPFAGDLVRQAGARQRRRPRLGGVPRGVPHGDRVLDLRLRALAHERRQPQRDDLPRAADHRRAQLGLLSEAPPAMAYVGGVLALVGVALARRKPRARVPEGAPA